MHETVERVIMTMWERYNESLSLDELADTAFLSRFYFSRLFRAFTGTSPGRFLTAIRLYKAKNLLLETSLSVTDIAYHVGYNSLGTFISRFTRSVGISPARYRAFSRAGIPQLPPTGPACGRSTGTVRGNLWLPPSDTPVRVYVGAFDSPIVQGRPAACSILESSGSYELNHIPEGVWYVRAAAVAVRDVDPRPWARRPLFVAAGEPVEVGRGSLFTMDLDLHPMGPLDLPILVALPELDSHVPPPHVATLLRSAS